MLVTRDGKVILSHAIKTQEKCDVKCPYFAHFVLYHLIYEGKGLSVFFFFAFVDDVATRTCMFAQIHMVLIKTIFW